MDYKSTNTAEVSLVSNSEHSVQSKNRSFIKRAVTWEISDSEADSDAETKNKDITLCMPAPGLSAAGSGEVFQRETPSVKISKDWLVEDDHGEERALTLPSSHNGLTLLVTPSVGKRRRKKTPEELREERAKAEQQKREREARKLEKYKLKEKRRLEIQSRKEAADVLKCLHPDQCVKYITVCIDPGLLKDVGSDTLMEALESMELRYSIEPQSVSCSITWRREAPSNSSITGLNTVEEDQIVMLAMPNEFLQLVNSMKQEPRELSSGGSSETLDMLAFSLPEQLPGKTATLVVLGLDVYQWCNGHFGFKCWKEEGSWREQLSVCPQTQNRDPQSCLDPAVTPMDIEEALVALQLQKNMGVLFMETWQELGEYITLLTKSVAKRPFKKQCENMAFSFCVEGSWASGIRVEKDGAGLHQVWKRQIQQFNRVSPLMAAAITAKYPSPQLLLQAYRECSMEQEKSNLLADLMVKSSGNDKERRIGPELSRKIYTYMISSNPELILDLNG
nr:PREDICTED: probable crossover junction endonuclease EME2 isoform X2 [Latimeria chalumnae]|eukprot:XP_014345010.1 PREDICTED: probable crossover junction endonuclease EME2 isoform X2 [Latimeria chalumnae]